MILDSKYFWSNLVEFGRIHPQTGSGIGGEISTTPYHHAAFQISVFFSY